ncbi:hypothetical protein RRG08_009245 [Elysia crispata]|uniref:NADH dehydrogenase [ubiquinone] 1 beta subcomplex subunit 10 n=1 Tax=Elysia crispata TaxID=231223 RepID=A0AAE1E868_9GAST|nr:hypothetical protein RRG08_009245 [Elysia crispata]
MGGEDSDHSKPVKSSITDLKIQNIAYGLFRAVDGPVTYFRENIVEPLQRRNTSEKFYHRQFKRVPTIDQCDFEDPVCIYEADQQFFRDKQVDSNIVKFLRQRMIECITWEGPDSNYKCRKLQEDYETTATNWFIKYGDIRTHKGSIEAYMKQKHRLIWERQHPDIKLH